MILRFVRQIVALLSGGGRQGWHLSRYTMYHRLRAVADVHLLGDKPGEALAISHSGNLAEVMGLDVKITRADFPEFDLLDLPFADGSFDYVLADQVLEHVRDPFRAFGETFRVLRPGGVMVHTTCLLNPIHEAADFFRFTPDALEMLAAAHGDVIEVGGWGNRAALPLKVLGLHRLPIPNSRWHPLHKAATASDPKWLMSTWVVALKP